MRDYSLTVVDECAISGKLAVGDDQPMQHGKPTQHDLSTVYTVYTVYIFIFYTVCCFSPFIQDGLLANVVTIFTYSTVLYIQYIVYIHGALARQMKMS